MVESIDIENFGPLSSLSWGGLGQINLIIGGNGSGKTFLLKGIYSALRTLEEYRRGDDQRSIADILTEKLYWTYQAERIGELVTKGVEGQLSFSLSLNGKKFSYGFGKDTAKQILNLTNENSRRDSNSIFLPAKEILSIHHIILKSREQDKVFGFDDTYLDLARALRQLPTRGKNYKEFSDSRNALKDILGGRIEFDNDSNRWYFMKGNQKYPIGVTAEGVKKIAILDTLLGNRYLDDDSIVFFDEPESALHPEAISQLVDIICIIAERGIQFFLASHSYFIIKCLFLAARKRNMHIPVLCEKDAIWSSDDLLDGMPDNRIIDESIRLYKEEVEWTLR